MRPSRRRRRRDRVGSLLLTAAGCAALAVPGVAASAGMAVGSSGVPPDGLRLVGQSVSVARDGDLVIDVETEADAVGAYTVAARPLPTDRDGLRAGLAADADPPVDEVEVSGERHDTAPTVRLTVPTESSDDSEERLALPASGPYAVTVTAPGGVHRLTTIVVRGDQAPPEVSLALAVVVDSPLTLQPDGTTTIDPAVRQQVAAVVDFLGRTTVPVSVLVRPELLAGLGRSGVPGDADLVARLGTALSSHHLLAAPYVSVDPSAATAAGLVDAFTDQLLAGEDALREDLDRFPDRRVWAALDPVTQAGASLVRDLGANVILRLAGAGRPPDVPPPGDAPVADVITPAGRVAVPYLDPDPAASLLSAGSDDPVLAACRLAGEVVAVHQASGSQGGVLLADLGTADPATLDALVAIVTLANGLAPARLLDVAAATTTGIVADDPVGQAPADLRDVATTRTDLLRLIGTTRAVLAPDDRRGDRWPEQADALLDSRLTSADRDDYAASLRTTLDGVHRSIVLLAPSAVNLGNRRSTVPISVRNDNVFPVTVAVRLVSAKFRSPPTSEAVTIAPGETAQLRIEVDARTNGRFPVTAELIAPGTGQRVGQPATFSVRVVGLTGLGIAITFAAGLVLATWWVQHLRRRRRRGTVARGRHPVGSAVASDVT